MSSSSKVCQGYNALINGLAIISGAIFGLMAFFIGADVFMRNVAGSGIRWVIESMEYAMYIATVFAAPWVLREGGHVSVDILTSMLPSGVSRIVAMFASLLGFAICLVVCYFSAIATFTAFSRGSMIYKSFTIPEWTISVFVPFGMALMCIEFILLFKARLAQPANR